MAPKVCEALDEIVVDLLAGRAFADDESLACKFVEMDLFGIGPWMAGGQHHMNPFGPQVLTVAVRPFGGAGDEGYVKLVLTNRRHMLGWIAIDEGQLDRAVTFAERLDQIGKKP